MCVSCCDWLLLIMYSSVLICHCHLIKEILFFYEDMVNSALLEGKQYFLLQHLAAPVRLGTKSWRQMTEISLQYHTFNIQLYALSSCSPNSFPLIYTAHFGSFSLPCWTIYKPVEAGCTEGFCPEPGLSSAGRCCVTGDSLMACQPDCSDAPTH